MPAGALDAYIGQRLLSLRIERSEPASRIAVALGVSTEKLHEFESGGSGMSATQLFDACMHFRVSITYFFEGYENVKASHPERSD